MKRSDRAPARVGGYAVTGVIGAGGFGTVYLGNAPGNGARVAVKVLDRGADDTMRARLRAEADAMRRINDPHCLHVLDVVDDGVDLAIVTELIAAASLRAVLDRSGRLTGPQALDAMRGVLLGLAAVHQAGLLHGDVKPANVLLDQRGIARLIDFGLTATPSAAPSSRGLTGSPAYMSPEQIRGEPLDARADLYACAVLLYELLCGQRPYSAPSVEATLVLHLTAPVPDPRAVDATISDRFAALCMAGLAKDPGARPQTAQAFLAALEAAAEEQFGAAWRAGAGLGAVVGAGAVGYLGLAGGVPGEAALAGHGLTAARAVARARWLSSTPTAIGAGVAATAVVVTAIVVAASASGGNNHRLAGSSLPSSSSSSQHAATTASLHVTNCPIPAAQTAGSSGVPAVPDQTRLPAGISAPPGAFVFGTGAPGEGVSFVLAIPSSTCSVEYSDADGGLVISLRAGSLKPYLAAVLNPGGVGPNTDLACAYIPEVGRVDAIFRGGQPCTVPPAPEKVVAVNTGSHVDVAAIVQLPPGVADPLLPPSAEPGEQTLGVFVAHIYGNQANSQAASCTLPDREFYECVAALQYFTTQSLLRTDASADQAVVTAIATVARH